MTEEEYKDKYQFLLDKEEYLSEKLKKYSFYSAKTDLEKEITFYQYNLAQARMCFNESITVHKLKNEVIEKITNAKMDNMPNEIPKIFDKPFIIESINSKTPLFGDINSIIGYNIAIPKEIQDEYKGIDRFPKNNLHCLLFHTIPKNEDTWYKDVKGINKLMEKEKADFTYLGLNLFRWSPYLEKTDWEFSAKDYTREILMNRKFCLNCTNKIGCTGNFEIDSINNYKFCFQGICDNIISFLTVLNYMLEVESTPVIAETKKSSIKRSIKKKNKVLIKNENWIIKYLYIDKKKIKYDNNNISQYLDKNELVKKNVQVRGHLRHQACGVGFKEHKWIYIESFISSKWAKEGDKKIIVST
jgi:hypothetical protein